MPALPRPMTLPALQAYVARAVEERGFTRDLNEIFILLTEETGELAAELTHRVAAPERFDRENLAYELADILLYLLDLANGFGLELRSIPPGPNDRGHREAGHPDEVPIGQGSESDLPLNRLVECVTWDNRPNLDTPEMLMIGLSVNVGEIATEIRKHWKHRNEARQAGLKINAALRILLRLARSFAIDLETAVREKERQNESRVWSY